ncbi:MAG: TauD/TfdA family dioxygenase, partial [Proteobacteria bacterium]|nr:TauD/TfdA family dioxygenase [Pseudomonadota bacterium]
MTNQLAIDATEATLGAVVTGVRLSNLRDDEWSKIESGFNEHALLIFPRQSLTDEQQMTFGRRFGELVIESLPFSNEHANGKLRKADDPLMRLFRGNEGWHTDSSFQPLSAKASILSARKVPPSGGGETEWADMRAAYDALDPATRERIEGLNAYHSLYHSQARIGAENDATAQGLAVLHTQPGSPSGNPSDSASQDAAVSAGYSDTGKIPLRPLVKIHPVTQRPALFIGRHAYGIPGLEPAESDKLLEDLVAFACQPPRVYQHRTFKQIIHLGADSDPNATDFNTTHKVNTIFTRNLWEFAVS